MTTNKTDEQRFWAKVDKSGDCWVWKASKIGSGYGGFRFRGKMRPTNRVVWVLTYGEIPDGLCVLHTCDNRLCVNPAHLYLGTIADNSRDMIARGRDPRGQDRGTSKLRNYQVLDIRRLYKEGRSMRSLAREYHVNPSTIASIVKGEKWKHLLAPAPAGEEEVCYGN